MLPRQLSWERIRLQCMRSRFNPWIGKIPWRRAWQPTPVFCLENPHGQRSLVAYSPWGHKELYMTERLSTISTITLLFIISYCIQLVYHKSPSVGYLQFPVLAIRCSTPKNIFHLSKYSKEFCCFIYFLLPFSTSFGPAKIRSIKIHTIPFVSTPIFSIKVRLSYRCSVICPCSDNENFEKFVKAQVSIENI